MNKSLEDMIRKIYWKNRRTYRLTMEFVYGKKGKIVILFKLLLSLIPIGIWNRKTEEELKKIRENGNIYTLRNAKTVFYLPDICLDNGEFIQNKIFLDEDYFERRELEQVKNYVRGGVLDIGANIGNHTLFFCNECDVEKVYSFEPCKDTFDILKKNVEINLLREKVKLFNVACGEKRGKGNVIKTNSGDAGSNQIAVNNDGNVEIITIDELELENIDFIKIDVEGFEYCVLKGMEKLLQKCKPVIYVEIFKKNFDKVHRLLNKYGYKMEKEVFGNYVYIKI